MVILFFISELMAKKKNVKKEKVLSTWGKIAIFIAVIFLLIGILSHRKDVRNERNIKYQAMIQEYRTDTTMLSDTWNIDSKKWYLAKVKIIDAKSVKINDKEVIGSWNIYETSMNLLLSWNSVDILIKNKYELEEKYSFTLTTKWEVQEKERILKEEKKNQSASNKISNIESTLSLYKKKQICFEMSAADTKASDNADAVYSMNYDFENFEELYNWLIEKYNNQIRSKYGLSYSQMQNIQDECVANLRLLE